MMPGPGPAGEPVRSPVQFVKRALPSALLDSGHRPQGSGAMKQAGISLFMLFGLAGCAATQPLQPESPGPQIASDGACHADRVAWAVGQPSTQEVMARVWKESGAGLIRPLAPGQAATRDYKPDRINIDIDAKNLITRVYCG